MRNDKRDQFHQVVLHGETLVFIVTSNVAAVAEVQSGSTFRENKPVSHRKFKKVSRNRLCYKVQRMLKLVSHRRRTQVSAKSFNV